MRFLLVIGLDITNALIYTVVTKAQGVTYMKKTLAILMSTILLGSATLPASAVSKPTHKVVASAVKSSKKAVKKKAKLNVKSAIKTARNYGTKLKMHYDKTLTTDNANWFSPTNTKYYKKTTELKKALKDYVRYVAYFYKDSGVVPSDIIFNIIKENSRIYVVYC